MATSPNLCYKACAKMGMFALTKKLNLGRNELSGSAQLFLLESYLFFYI